MLMYRVQGTPVARVNGAPCMNCINALNSVCFLIFVEGCLTDDFRDAGKQGDGSAPPYTTALIAAHPAYPYEGTL